MKTAVLPEGRLGIAAAAVEGRMAEAAVTEWLFIAVLGAIVPPSERLLNVVWVYWVERGVTGMPSWAIIVLNAWWTCCAMPDKFGVVIVEAADAYSGASEVERARFCSIAACVEPAIIEVAEASSCGEELVHTNEAGEIDVEPEFESRIREILAVDEEFPRETEI